MRLYVIQSLLNKIFIIKIIRMKKYSLLLLFFINFAFVFQHGEVTLKIGTEVLAQAAGEDEIITSEEVQNLIDQIILNKEAEIKENGCESCYDHLNGGLSDTFIRVGDYDIQVQDNDHDGEYDTKIITDNKTGETVDTETINRGLNDTDTTPPVQMIVIALEYVVIQTMEMMAHLVEEQ